jgi:hypothetical protein
VADNHSKKRQKEQREQPIAGLYVTGKKFDHGFFSNVKTPLAIDVGREVSSIWSTSVCLPVSSATTHVGNLIPVSVSRITGSINRTR